MSKVKRRTVKKAVRKSSVKKTQHRSRKSATPARQSAVKFLTESWKRFAVAAGAGLALVVVAALAIFWASGYFGLMVERANHQLSVGVAAVGFEVRRVTVKGRNQTSSDEIQDALGPVVGDSILHFDPYAARARIEELGWVRSAAVSRLWPDTIQVSIRERSPAAVWQLSGTLYLIDRDGGVIREIGAYEYSYLPLIVGAGAPEAASGILRALEGAPELAEKITALVRVSGRRWNLRFQNGLDVKLPEADLEAAINDLTALHAAHGTLDDPLEYIDLRDPERVILRHRGDAKERDEQAPPAE